MSRHLEPVERARPVVEAALAKGLTVATAESLTAGLIASTLAEVPGSSAILLGGVVCYAAEVKCSVLGVDAELVDRVGTVDAEVARQMALGAQRLCSASLAVSATGAAGPEPHDGKPVGTVFIGWSDAESSGAVEHHFVGSRDAIRRQSMVAALDQLQVMIGKASSQHKKAK